MREGFHVKLVLRDAFGAAIGLADVKWTSLIANPEVLEEEIEAIFPDDVVTVLLPTRNAAMSWRFDVYPKLKS